MPDVGFKLTVRSKGAGRAALDLTRLGDRASDVRPAKDAVKPIFHQDEKTRFDRQGPRWPPLADATKEHKARLGLDPRILRSSGALYESLVTAPGETPSRTQIAFGTPVYYARFHQGGKAKPGEHTTHRPKRKVIALAKRSRDEITGVLEGFIAQGKT